ncbi:fatty acid binding protein 4a isoform X2 [Hippocampus comes]|uniref:Cellular retinoic acid-binding protein 1 n=1 Tax=Hippocampus comes TaxID=109280 RepID=A0A3Q2YCP6_HIPCM|nr:PREDICTED: fatty acid-binding protein, heart-like isoform X1 [Hippocampus comes]XP_019745809.1 PREDICTED: fatty acid-binding protein, heart-like isoform X2 [Hippocampus comes]XP_051927283.1 fatty acid binding protein 4a [Hippocampus zosterae]
MVEKFVGTWKMISSENFDDYMKAIGVGFAIRQVGNRTKPNLIVTVDEQGTVSMKTQSTFKTSEIKFKLNEPFEETTADDRKTRTVISLENGKLVQKQSWDGKETSIEREVTDGKLIARCIMGDVVAVRTYVREA